MRVLLRLTRYSWRYKWGLIGAYVSAAGATLSIVFIPRVIGTAVDTALASGLRSQLLLLAGVIFLLGLTRAAFTYGASRLAESVSQQAAFDLRNDYFRKLQSLSFGFHDKEQTGNLMSRGTYDVESVRRFMSYQLISGLSLVLTLGAAATLMLTMNWRLGIVSLVPVPFVMWVVVAMVRRRNHHWYQAMTETGHMTTVLQESLTNMRVVKAFGAQEHEQGRFHQRSNAIFGHMDSINVSSSSRVAIVALAFSGITGAILWLGGREVIFEHLTPGDLTAFFLYMGLLSMPLAQVGFLATGLAQTASGGQRLFEILDAESPVKEKPGAADLPRAQGRVKFDHVSHSYDPEIPTISDVSFEVEPGQLVAILGAAGSGKSTIAHLIPRFYEVSRGSVTIDGTDIRDVTLSSLRQSVGIVLQDTFAFADTLKNNIAYGVDDVSMAEVIRAAKVAHLHDFIEGLPHGYDTWVGERGITLSGGQRQRLAIARTILLDPPILILDDSTSSVDVATERHIQEALAGVVKGRTTFVIAHRLSTVRSADLILVVEDGNIVERGTHEELLARDGKYRHIHDLQLRPQDTST